MAERHGEGAQIVESQRKDIEPWELGKVIDVAR